MRSVQAKVARRQLPLHTATFIVGFMVWVIVSSLMPFIKESVPLTQTEIAWVIAVPVILGSLLRIPFGYLAGRFGARKVYLVSFCTLLFPLFFISGAATVADLLIGGVFLGVAGAVFSVGVTSLPKYYPKEKWGFVNGVYGVGNIGTAITAFGAPPVALAFGWQTAVRMYLALVVMVVAANLIWGDRSERKLVMPVAAQLKTIIPDFRLWMYSLFYFLTFGTFVAFTIIAPNFLATAFGLDGVGAGCATGVFIVLAAGFRVLGGWLADRYPVGKLLVVVFVGMGVGAAVLASMPDLMLYLGALYTISMFCGIGNGVLFKLVPSAFPNQAGLANGIVAMAGGLGGFFPPLVLALFLAATGSYAPGFLLYLAGIGTCLIATLFLVRNKA